MKNPYRAPAKTDQLPRTTTPWTFTAVAGCTAAVVLAGVYGLAAAASVYECVRDLQTGGMKSGTVRRDSFWAHAETGIQSGLYAALAILTARQFRRGGRRAFLLLLLSGCLLVSWILF